MLYYHTMDEMKTQQKQYCGIFVDLGPFCCDLFYGRNTNGANLQKTWHV